MAADGDETGRHFRAVGKNDGEAVAAADSKFVQAAGRAVDQVTERAERQRRAARRQNRVRIRGSGIQECADRS
ncbi:MAG: hypothetical protein OXE40_06540, partial [Gammaproteobacteria bacterium]|nr:hypothetical protein [Gammaproteobacteria bacterium]